MRLPSIKTLNRAFPGKGKELRLLLEGKTNTTDYKSVRDWVAQCWHPPKYVERLLMALNEILEGHGTEPIWSRKSCTWPEAEYVNMGDTYNATILYDYGRGTIQVTTWGDWVERNERRIAQ